MQHDLNLNQRAAVEAGDEPLLVVAGPGAGKSTVLHRRIERLLSKRDALDSYWRVLAVTFTNVAADNLRAKIADTPDALQERVEIGTFHRFAARLLQQHGSHVKISPSFEIVSDNADRKAIFERATSELMAEGALSEYPQQGMLQLISRLYETVPDAAAIEEILDPSLDANTVRRIFERYIDVSVQLNQLDFPLLVYLADKVLTLRPAIARQTRAVYHYICVDEFQDTNDAQFRFLRTLVGPDATGLFLLADQDQVIYQWNGATPLRLREAQEHFDLNVLELPTSYRCPVDIIAAANSLISHNSTRFLKPQFDSAYDDKSNHINFDLFSSDTEEVAAVARALRLLHARKNASCAVLARNKQLLLKIKQSADAIGLKSELPTAKYEWASPPVRMLYAMLKLANQPSSEKYVSVLLEAFYKITGVSLDAATLMAEAATEESTVLRVFANQTSKRARSIAFMHLIEYVTSQLITRKIYRGLSSLVFNWVDQLPQVSARESFLTDYTSEKGVWLELEGLHSGLQSDDISLDEFLRQIDLSTKSRPTPGAIPLLTVHAAKGLEFDHVFLIGAAEKQFPAYQAVMAGGDSHAMEEERRSFFVAITRTRKNLSISCAQRYSGYPSTPSRFLREMGIDPERYS